MSTEEPNDWSVWQSLLANPKEIRSILDNREDRDPCSGFYRLRFGKTSPWEPVAIYRDGEEWVALVSGEMHDKFGRFTGGDFKGEPYVVEEVWNRCCGQPISLEEYERVAERGEEWSDSDPVVAQQIRKAPRPGHNSGDVDEAEQLRDQIESALAGAKAYVIRDDETAAKAQSLRSRLLELHREADKAFHAEKDPITKHGKEVDARWRFRSDAQEGADGIRDKLKAFENAKLQAQRKREAEEAEKKRLEEEAQRKKEAEARAAEAASVEGEPFAEPEPQPEPEPAPAPSPAPVQTTLKGSYGRAATVTAKIVVDQVTDQDALYAYLREHKEVKELLFDLAQRAHKAGRTNIPGISLKEEVDVR